MLVLDNCIGVPPGGSADTCTLGKGAGVSLDVQNWHLGVHLHPKYLLGPGHYHTLPEIVGVGEDSDNDDTNATVLLLSSLLLGDGEGNDNESE